MPLEQLFPLYDLLKSQIDKSEVDQTLNDNEIKNLIQKINVLDKFGRDIVYVIIRIHSLRNTNSKLMDVPYGGNKIAGKNSESDATCDVKFDVRNFPPVLARMIDKFTDLHLRKISEDQTHTK